MKIKHPTAAGVLLVALASLVLELTSDRFWMPLLDIDDAPDTPLYRKMLEAEWALMHLPWLRALDSIERITGCHDGNVVAGCGRVDMTAIFAGGFVDTALLLGLAIIAIIRVRGILKRRACRHT